MSEWRDKGEVLIKKLPGKQGNFLTKIKVELFPAAEWMRKFSPLSPKRKSCKFFIRAPHSFADEELAMTIRHPDDVEGYYRLRVDGRWYGPAEYSFYNKSKAYEILEYGED